MADLRCLRRCCTSRVVTSSLSPTSCTSLGRTVSLAVGRSCLAFRWIFFRGAISRAPFLGDNEGGEVGRKGEGGMVKEGEKGVKRGREER